MGAVAARLSRRGDRHRRQSARRGSGADSRRSARRSPGRDRDRRSPRSDRRSDPNGAAGRHHPARRQGPRDGPDHRRRRSSACCRSTMRWSRGSARRERAVDLRRNRGRDRRPRERAFEVTGVTFDSREVEPGDLFIAMPGTRSRRPQVRRRGLCGGRCGRNRLASRSTVRTCWSRTRRRRSRTSAARRASARRRRSSASPDRSARPAPRKRCYAALDRIAAGQGPSLGQELQQPYRRAAEPRPDAARSRVCGARNGHEQQGRDRRADAAWSARTSRSSPPSPRRTSRISAPKRRSPTPRPRSSRGWSRTASRSSPTTRPHRDRLVKAARRYADRIVTFGSGDADVHALHAVRSAEWRKPDHRARCSRAS